MPGQDVLFKFDASVEDLNAGIEEAKAALLPLLWPPPSVHAMRRAVSGERLPFARKTPSERRP